MSNVARQGDRSLGTVVINHSVTPGVFAAIFTPTGKLIVSENQPGGTNISSNSSYTINANDGIAAISQSLPTRGDDNCWNVITSDGKYAYVDNSVTSTVAGFSVAPDGTLTPIAGTILGNNPAGTINLDVKTSTDGKFSTPSIRAQVPAAFTA